MLTLDGRFSADGKKCVSFSRSVLIADMNLRHRFTQTLNAPVKGNELESFHFPSFSKFQSFSSAEVLQKNSSSFSISGTTTLKLSRRNCWSANNEVRSCSCHMQTLHIILTHIHKNTENTSSSPKTTQRLGRQASATNLAGQRKTPSSNVYL